MRFFLFQTSSLLTLSGRNEVFNESALNFYSADIVTKTRDCNTHTWVFEEEKKLQISLSCFE